MFFDSQPELALLSDDLPLFAQRLQQLAQTVGLTLSAFSADHISLRCNKKILAEQWRGGLLQCGTLFSESIINGRLICLFELSEPLPLLSWKISVIELPYPGQKEYPFEGWEHVELVLPVKAEKLFDTARQLLPTPLPDGIFIKESSPKRDCEHLPNPTFAISNGIVTIKYHPFPLRMIVQSEQKE